MVTGVNCNHMALPVRHRPPRGGAAAARSPARGRLWDRRQAPTAGGGAAAASAAGGCGSRPEVPIWPQQKPQFGHSTAQEARRSACNIELRSIDHTLLHDRTIVGGRERGETEQNEKEKNVSSRVHHRIASTNPHGHQVGCTPRHVCGRRGGGAKLRNS